MDLQERDRQYRLKQKQLETTNGLVLCEMLKCLEETDIYDVNFYVCKEYNTQILVVENELTNECYIMFRLKTTQEYDMNMPNLEVDENCTIVTTHPNMFDEYSSIREHLLKYYNKYYDNVYFIGKKQSYLVNMGIMDCKFHNINTNIKRIKLGQETRVFMKMLTRVIRDRFGIVFD